MRVSRLCASCVATAVLCAPALAVNLSGPNQTLALEDSVSGYSGQVGSHNWSCADPDNDGLPETVSVDGTTVTTTARPYINVVNQVNIYVGTTGADSHSYAGNAYESLMFGGPGSDVLTGSPDQDETFGGAGDDLLDGQQVEDELVGGSGNDCLQGSTGSDVEWGGSGDDVVFGGSGDDQLYGGVGTWQTFPSGKDLMAGGNGNDVVRGEDDDDLFWCSEDAADLYVGGLGADTFADPDDQADDSYHHAEPITHGNDQDGSTDDIDITGNLETSPRGAVYYNEPVDHDVVR